MCSQKCSLVLCIIRGELRIMACHAYSRCRFMFWHIKTKLSQWYKKWKYHCNYCQGNSARIIVLPWKRVDSQRYQSRQYFTWYGWECVYQWLWSISSSQEGIEEEDICGFPLLDGSWSCRVNRSWFQSRYLVSWYNCYRISWRRSSIFQSPSTKSYAQYYK